MAIDFSEDFSGGTHGATITTSNTAFDTVQGSPTFDSATSIAGLAAKFPGGTSTSVQHNFTATSQRYFRRYFRMTGNPSAATVIAHARSGTSARVQIRVMTTGKLQLRNGVIAAGAESTTTLAADTWYRLEWKLDGTASTQTLRIFHGANLHGTVPDEEMARLYDTGTADNALGGHITAATWVTYEDKYASDPTDWPGPFSQSQTITATGVATGEAFGAAAATLPAHTLRDDFTTLDSARWVHWGTAAVSGGALHITCSADYDAVESQNRYSLIGSSVYVQTLGWPTGASTEMYLRAFVDVNNQVIIGKSHESLGLRVRTAGTWDEAYITFDSTAHAWWRIAEAAGTLTLDSSADGRTWTTRKSVATPAWAIATQLHLQTGYWGTESSPGEAVFDNLNVAPPLLPGAIASGEAHGTPSIAVGAVTIATSGTASVEAFGALTVTVGAATVAPTAVASAQAVGEPAVALGGVAVSPPGIAPGDFGAATLTTGLVTLYPASATSAEALGTAVLARPIAELADDFTGPDIDLTRWALAGV